MSEYKSHFQQFQESIAVMFPPREYTRFERVNFAINKFTSQVVFYAAMPMLSVIFGAISGFKEALRFIAENIE